MLHFRLRTSLVLLISICLIGAFLTAQCVCAADSTEPSRTASWYQTQYGTSPWGGTWTMGQFGPDVGMGEQGYRYQYSDPMTGAFVSYSTTGMGMGLGGPLMGYGGMFSPLAGASYGPYAYGGTAQPMPTYGWGTQGSASGSLFGPQTSFYQAQPGLAWMLGGGLGGFGGYGGGYGLMGGSGLMGGYGLMGGFGGYGLMGGFGGLGGFGGGWW